MDVLGVITTLIESLSAHSIRYVHWKSNEHLLPALRGETDLDLLVEADQEEVFQKVLRELEFVPLVPARIRRIPGSESYLGFDESTGTLVHLDVQYDLVVGEQLLKNYRLPVESWLLSDSVELHGVQVPQPERELVLLYVRTMLKTTSRQILRSRVKGGSPVPERISKEAIWLADRVSPDRLRLAAATSRLGLTGDELVDFRDRVAENRLDRDYISSQRSSLRTRLAGYRRMPLYLAGPKKAMLRVRSRPWARTLHIEIPKRRIGGNGVLVAAVGADGSGKTRLTRDLESWLQQKLQVRHLYFGQPKNGVMFKLLNKPGSIASKRDRRGVLDRVARYTDSMKWVILARKRRSMARSARTASRTGEIFIAERFPLREFHSMDSPMDGPRLQPGGLFARSELRQYQAIEAPDLTIVLKTNLQTLRDRKLDLTIEEHTAKVAAVEGLNANNGRVVIDAGRPYEEVLLEAQTAIWKKLIESR
jgi:hypothetical protein